MTNRKISRRLFAASTAGLIVATPGLVSALPSGGRQDGDKQEGVKQNETPKPEPQEERSPVEAPFERDYDAPSFKPSWKNPQINRQMAQDFVIFAHGDFEKMKMLYEREPGLLNATIDWGAGDWETALGGSSHMGRKDIVEFLLSKGARIDIFCAAMMGMLETVQTMLKLEPALIDAKGPHGFTLHFHAQVGQEGAKPVLDYLQSIKELELKPVPFLKAKPESKG